MNYRMIVVFVAVLVLSGAQGCASFGSTLRNVWDGITTAGRAVDKKLGELEKENERLKARIEDLEEAASNDEETLAALWEMESEISEQLKDARQDVKSIGESVSDFEMKIKTLYRAPLDEDETQEDREDKIEGFERELQFQKGRLIATQDHLDELQRTVDIANRRLQAQSTN